MTFQLNHNSTQDEAVFVLNQIKSELNELISKLTALKSDVIDSDSIEIAAKSKVRIAIETLLIDLNEEMFALSESVANSY